MKILRSVKERRRTDTTTQYMDGLNIYELNGKKYDYREKW
jgi:hypothetical protein